MAREGFPEKLPLGLSLQPPGIRQGKSILGRENRMHKRWKLQEKYGDFQLLHLAQYECCTEVQVCVLGVRLEMKGGRAREVGRSQNKGPYIPY